MHKIGILFCSLLLLGVLATEIACTSDKLPEPEPPELCDTLQVSYNLQVKEIIDTYCAISGCHRAGSVAPGNYTSYIGLDPFLNDNEFKRYVVDLKNDPDLGMPPDWDTNPGPKDLTPEHFDILVCWIENGYPED
jgi:hypothetical protein